MPAKPTDQEDEYFARLERERRRNVFADRATRAVVTEDTGFFGSARRIFS